MDKFDSPYSPNKIYFHQDKIEQLRRGDQIVPLRVQLIISDYCQHSCGFCAYRSEGYSSNELFYILDKDGKKNHNPPRWIPYEKCIEILDDFAEMGVKAVEFTGGGSPTAHPKHDEIFKAAIDRGLEVGLVTHGNLVRPKTLDSLCQGNWKWIRVSVDAGNANTYASIRNIPEKNFELMLNNLNKVCNTAKKENSDLVVGTGFVVTKENYKEIVDWVKIAKDVGVDNVRISAVFTTEGIGYFDGFWDEASALVKEATSYSNDNFKVFNNFGDRSSDLIQQNPDYQFCGYQQANSYIGADLGVYRCCVLAYNSHGLIGSIKDQSFKEFWYSQEKIDKIGKFDARSCKLCMVNNKNRQIIQAINQPRHINFI